MNRSKFFAIATALIASAALVTQARAGYDTLHVGTPYGPQIEITNTTVGLINGSGGDFQNSSLNGKSLPWVYCVDVVNGVAPPATFPYASVTNNGVVNGAAVNNAAEIAYILVNNASGSSNQGAIQAAIWFEEYGTSTSTIVSIGGSPTNPQIALANSYVAAANSYVSGGDASLVGKLAWLTADSNPSDTYYNKVQGLVTLAPEPSSMAIAGLAGLGMVFYARKRRGR